MPSTPAREKGVTFFGFGSVSNFLDFVWLTTRTPHGSYVWGAKRNRIDPHRVKLNGSSRSPCRLARARADRSTNCPAGHAYVPCFGMHRFTLVPGGGGGGGVDAPAPAAFGLKGSGAAVARTLFTWQHANTHASLPCQDAA